jgi:subtilisin family serine protease
VRRLSFVSMVVVLLLSVVVPAVAAGEGGAQGRSGAVSDGAGSKFPDNGRYVVVMTADPLVTTFGQDGLDTTEAKAKGSALVRSHDRALEAVGESAAAKVYDYTVSLNGFAVALTDAEATEMASVRGVAMVLPDVMRYPQTDASPDFLGLTAPGGPWDAGFDGEGVVVGIVDTGIWPEHPSFADDGSYAPPPTGPLPCDFGNTTANPADAPFTCNNKLIGAYQMLDTYRAVVGADPDEFDSARDDEGHGTHTASTAAGNAGVEASIYGIPRGTISGMAPRAYVVAYKALGNLGGFSSDLAAAIDQAVADGVDVINYSVGGGASLTGADDIAFLFAADAGVYVATSAGNSGPGPGTIGGPSSVPWVTSVGASTQSRFFQGTVVLGNGAEYQGASITEGTDPMPLVDAAALGNELCDPDVAFTGDISGKMVLCERGAVGRAAKSYAVSLAGGAAMILYNTVDTDNLFSDTHWVPSVHVDLTPGLAIKAYIAGAGSSATASITGEQVSTWPSAPSMTIFSSRGPNPVAPDIIKPDITAPGLQILAGASPVTDPGFVPGELFQAIAGTSMSSPHIAGIYALVKQAHPRWSAAAAKSALMTTAYQDVVDNDRVSPADPFDMGAGHVDVLGNVTKGKPFQPGLVYEAGFYDYLGFLCDEAPEVFANPTATCGFLDSIGVPTEAENLNYPSIGISEVPGSATVSRTVTSVVKANRPGGHTFEVSVDAPDGFDVVVEPDVITLKKGQSATYSVTVTNQSAPIGEWRFGSLTWASTAGNYDVYSPIAVRGTELQAPAELSATGVSGSLSFPVTFGYTGSYTAAAHGLEPATITSDNVVQDPDQNFDPTDGFSNAHTFNLSGAMFFRVAIPPDATEPDADLDVYVYDPTDTLVASSTKGGTDELVDILEPMDGTWTVYVHGWSTPGGDSDYDMSSWVISGTPGGSLTLESAPTSATSGSTETITVSWTGLAAETEYLGAVSHTGPSGLIGVTLVKVST